ncbi:hypothetical protein SAMN05216534_0193 [Candidatus Aquiluna sp. UB-MaderosW2red]|nr:hypothetical protein SAMN05216534_0193 [Candidatus Aquiluna sp. UB-MaderosW2red]
MRNLGGNIEDGPANVVAQEIPGGISEALLIN